MKHKITEYLALPIHIDTGKIVDNIYGTTGRAMMFHKSTDLGNQRKVHCKAVGHKVVKAKLVIEYET